MQETLLNYYERELTYVRKLGQEFAQEYPKVAGRLGIETGKCDDPHVERLIQAFAFIAARVHHKIDDEFPEITDALLGLLYPHYLAPIPSMSIVQFVPDPAQGKLTAGYRIDKGTPLYSRPVGGTQCRFRTCYPTTLWPIDIDHAQFVPPDQAPRGVKAAAALRLELCCHNGSTFADLELEHLRVFLHGEGHVTHRVYELLLNNSLLTGEVCGVRVDGKDTTGVERTVELPSHCLRPVGYEPDQGILPYGPHSFLGYRLLQEYFTFPQKFLFFDLCELQRIREARFGDAQFRDRLRITIFLDRAPQVEQAIDAGLFRLGCTPIVNLFHHIAEPIRIDHTQFSYRVIPDIRRQGAMEVYSIDGVTCSSPHRSEAQTVLPLYTVKHASADHNQTVYWHATRKSSMKHGDDGMDMYLSLVDLDFNPQVPASDTLTLRVTCTNRDLPGKLPPMSDEGGYFELEGAAPLSRIRYLVKPTKTLRPALGGANQWRLISHLSLNYMSLVDGGHEALQEILRLYDYADSSSVKRQISGIAGVSSRRVVRRPSCMEWNGFCRGLEVTMDFDEDKFVGSGVFMFASVLERFLGLYTSINSFVEFVAKSNQREEPLRRWPPRAGEQILL